MDEIVLTFGDRTWIKVRHLFEGKPGHWGSGVSINGTWLTPVEVTCPMELAKVVMPMLDAERIPYSRRSAL